MECNVFPLLLGLQVDYDDDLKPFYAVKLSDGREKSTIFERLRPIAAGGSSPRSSPARLGKPGAEAFEKGQSVDYNDAANQVWLPATIVQVRGSMRWSVPVFFLCFL